MHNDLTILNATEFYARENSLPYKIPSFSKSLDDVLGRAGLELCALTEILGLPGTGKTQICLQLCASIQIPSALGGMDSEALYIDTNTDFTLQRYKDLQRRGIDLSNSEFSNEDQARFLFSDFSSSLCYHMNNCKEIYTISLKPEKIYTPDHCYYGRTDDIIGIPEILSATLLSCQLLLDLQLHDVDKALKKLHYVSAFGLQRFSAFMNTIPRFLAEHPNIKLIVIDSISFPFKEGISAKQRTGLVFRQMAELQRLSVEKQIAVVLTNEMSHRAGLASGPVVGALGDAWAHRCNRRVLLSTPEDAAGQSERVALLLKSNCITNDSSTVARFQITEGGIRDIDENTT